MPSVTASVRLEVPSFPKIEATWNFTVCSEMPRVDAISRLLRPAVIIRKTSVSRGVSSSSPGSSSIVSKPQQSLHFVRLKRDQPRGRRLHRCCKLALTAITPQHSAGSRGEQLSDPARLRIIGQPARRSPGAQCGLPTRIRHVQFLYGRR